MTVQAQAPVVSLTVTLTTGEMEAARQHALRVHANAVRRGFNHKYHTPGESPIDWMTRGYAAEMAVAKYLNFPWEPWLPSTINYNRKRGDVAGIEVRNAKRDDGLLTVYENDPLERPVLLVTGSGPTFVLRGWAFASEARTHGMRSETNNGSPTWRLRQSYLHPAWTVPIPDENPDEEVVS